MTTIYCLELNTHLYPDQEWSHRATFNAQTQDIADAMTLRWARHHGFDARAVRARLRTPLDTPHYPCDDFMEQFR